MIDKFSGKYHFLSNFSEAEVWLDGQSYPSTEHAYQAAKTLDTSWRRRIQMAETPNEAKRLGRKAPIRDGWEDMKIDVMYKLVRQKFRQHPRLSELILDTGDSTLVEGNWWGDRFWGVCNGDGENHLGIILMRVREEMRDKIAS
jgi:N-glycosidase YbiA